jgi:hypothetical protein
MQVLTLHRGFAVAGSESEKVIAKIRNGGLSGTEGRWKFQIPDISEVRTRLETLFAKPDLTREDIFAARPFAGICACGTASGAAYYAIRHNVSPGEADHSIAIEFTAPMEQVYVDPRDFLCTAFQLWDRESPAHQEWQAEVLADLFGSRILRYFSAACRSSDQTCRIAMCNLAAFDPAVVQGHFANTKVIAGRYNTRFSSAFFVKAPIGSSRIRLVYTPHYEEDMVVDISLRAFIHGDRA